MGIRTLYVFEVSHPVIISASSISCFIMAVFANRSSSKGLFNGYLCESVFGLFGFAWFGGIGFIL